MIFADKLGNPEGPVIIPDGSWVVAEMHPDRGCLTRISRDGRKKQIIAKTGIPNGIAMDQSGTLWVAESVNPPALLKVNQHGTVSRVLTECDGKPFLWPNDLCFGPDGFLYMTDSGTPRHEWARLTPEQKLDVSPDGRIYRIDTGTADVEVLDSGLPFANGIAFGPDRRLYVGATSNGVIYRYPWHEGRIGTREDFANVWKSETEGFFRGPDGMAFGRDGSLYVAVVWQGDVAVLNPDGTLVKRIETAGPGPTNVAFGPAGEKRLYVTEQGIGQMEVFDVDTDGLPLLR
jgi:gluconolactonase